MRNASTAIVMGGMLAQQVSAFVTGVWIARQLGPEGFGAIAILKNIATFLLILTPLGLDLALLKHAAIYSSDGRQFRITSTALRLIVAIINLTLVALVAFPIGPELQKVYPDVEWFSYYFTVSMIGICFAADVQISGALYRAAGRLNSYSLVANYSQSVFRLLLSFAALHAGWGVEGIIWVNAVSYASSFFLLTVLDKRAEQGLTRPTIDAFRKSTAILQESLWMALSLLVYQMMRFMDVLVLGALTTVQITGQYNAISGIAQIIQIYPTAISQLLGPRIADLYREKAYDEIATELKRYLRKATLLGGYMFAGVAVFGTQLDLVFGAGFHFSWSLAVLLASGWFASATLAPFGYVLSMTGRHRSELAILTGGAVVLLVCLFTLVPFFGEIGAALSVLIAFVSVNGARCAYAIKIIGRNPLSWSDILPPCFFFAVAFACLYVGEMVFVRSLTFMVVEAAAYTLLSGLVYIFGYMDAADRRRYELRILKRWAIK